MRIKQTFIIEYEAPYPDSIEDSRNWLCADNVEMLLRDNAPGGAPYKITILDRAKAH